MRHRFTIKELRELPDIDILKMLVVERMSTDGNVYAPLYQRLEKLSRVLYKSDLVPIKKWRGL